MTKAEMSERSPPASRPFKGQITDQTTVKCLMCEVVWYKENEVEISELAFCRRKFMHYVSVEDENGA